MMLADKVVIVTGAAGGIGFAAARYAFDNGAAVVCVDREGLGPEQRAAFAAAPDRLAEAASCDVTRRDDAEAAAALAVERFGRIDGGVNSAGIDRHHDFFDLGEDEFSRILDVNVLGSFRVSQAAARHMAKAPRAGRQSYSIVHVSSVNAVIASPTHVAYATSKGAIAQLTRVMAVELAPVGVRVNAVGPGTVRTTMLDDMLRDMPDALDKMMTRTPMARLAEPEEVAAPIGFLLSDEASFITGQTLYVDGGRTILNLNL